MEEFKAFTGVVRGHDLTVHTDHLNLWSRKIPSEHMMQWTLLLEKFHPKVVHIKGVENDVTNSLSRFDLIDKTEMMDIICTFLLEPEFKETGFNSNIMMSMTEIDDPSCILDLKSM